MTAWSWTNANEPDGIGYSQHAGQVIVCDGTPEADERIKRVLTNDPMMGIFRHADAGYDLAPRPPPPATVCG